MSQYEPSAQRLAVRVATEPLPAVRNEGEFHEFLHQLDRQLEQLEQARTQLEWAKKWREPYDSTLQMRIAQADDKLRTAQAHETLKTWKDRVGDPLVRRWAEVLDWQFTLARIEQQPNLRKVATHIADRYVQWRPRLNGQELPYTQQTWILRHESDRAKRRAAWMAQWELDHELQSVTREMFQLRNESARALGYPTYADLKLKADGVTHSWLVALIEEMERVTAPVFSSYLAQQAEKEKLPDVQPWDIQYLFDQDPWPAPQHFPANKLYDNLMTCVTALGLPESELGQAIRVYWYDSPYGGQCVTYTPRDIRILTNQGDGMLYYHTAYHEYGHALHSWYYAQPFSLRREAGMFTEGMAQFMALFLHYPSWLRRTGLPEPEIARYRDTRKLPWIYRHRRIAADVMAELGVWADPTRDCNQLYGETTARYLGTGFQPRPFAAVPRWTHPVQMQSYFIADLISTQTHAFLRKNFAPIFGRPEAIAHVRDHYWQPGNAVSWLEKIQRCTGEPLSYQALGIEMTQPLPDV